MTKLMHFFNHSLRNKKKQKGVTFLEILAVLVILVLIYLAYARSFGQGTDKAKLSDVQNSFKQYQLGYEDAMNENSGLAGLDYTSLNAFMQADYRTATTGAFGATSVDSNYKDPWKTPFQMQAKTLGANSNEYMLVVRSKGKDKLSSTDAFSTAGANDSDDVIMVTYYLSGITKSCTKGLSKDLGTMNVVGNVITGCQ